MKTIEQNMVCVLKREWDGSGISINTLQSLIPGETPQTLVLGPEGTVPMIFKYFRAGLEAVVLPDRVQLLSTSPPETKASKEFPALAKKVVASCGVATFKALGFNFDFGLVGENATKLFGLEPIAEIDGFEQLTGTFVQMVFGKSNARFIVNVKDMAMHQPNGMAQGLRGHVNVHYEQDALATELAELVEESYRNSKKEAVLLLEEVLRRATGTESGSD